MDDFTPQARKIAVLVTTGPAAPGNDLGGYGIYVELCPRLAGPPTTREMRFVRRNGAVLWPAQVDRRTLVRVFDCPWRENEDENRLHDRIAALCLRMRLHAEYLRENGEPIFVAAGPNAPGRVLSGPAMVLAGIGLALAVLWMQASSTGSGAEKPRK
jgi:hypothetical protein